jgi:hypothetical protein
MFCLQAANARDLASSLWALATLGYTPQRSFLAAFGAQVIGNAQWWGQRWFPLPGNSIWGVFVRMIVAREML